MDRNKPPTKRHGVVIICPPEDIEINLNILREWFEDRDDVNLVDSGKSDKRGEGIIILLFAEGYPDRWFLNKLEEDDTIHDYVVYEDE